MQNPLHRGFCEVFGESGCVALLVDPRSGEVVDANPTALSYYGYPREQLIGMSLNQMNSLPWEEIALERKRALFPERNCFAFRHRLASGEERDVEICFSPVTGDGVPLLLSIIQDVTRLRQTQEELRISDAIYRTAFQKISLDAVSITRDSDGMFIDVNDSMLKMLGYERNEIIGRTSLELGMFEDIADRQRVASPGRSPGQQQPLEIALRRKNGSVFWGVASVSTVEIDRIPCRLSVVRDISDAKAAEDRFRNLTFFDTLTGLPNRRTLLERLHQNLVSGSHRLCKKALLLVDLDNFRKVNDALGPDTGDLLLQQSATRLKDCTGPEDMVARMAGDEFAVLLDNLSGHHNSATTQAKAVAEKMMKAFAQPSSAGAHGSRITASVGIVVFGNRLKNANVALQRADIALSSAKAAGRNAVRLFSPALQAVAGARAALEEDLRSAIHSDQLDLVYQPQVHSGQLIGAEALIRWNHPSLGTLLPSRFIPLAEETGLILPLGEWILSRVCLQIAAWAKRRQMSDIGVAINISARQFQQHGFRNQVLAALDRTGANPKNIKLELTETMLVDNFEDVITRMTDLKRYGFRFSIDDFGTGYSSLSYLKRLPLDELKIDRAFVRDILVDASSKAIAQTIISLGRAMGLSVIAEGVENEDQRDYLANLGCHSCQGYLFSVPLSAEEFERSWLASDLGSSGAKTIVDASANAFSIGDNILREKGNVAAAITEEILRLNPQLARADGAQLRGSLTSNAYLHVESLAGAIAAGSPEAFADYARWAETMLEARGIGAHTLEDSLSLIEKHMSKVLLPSEQSTVSSFLAGGRHACRDIAPNSEGVPPDGPFGPTMAAFLHAILAGQRETALGVIEEALLRGAGIIDIYVDVITEALYRVGSLWEHNEITVAQEHMASACTQYVISMIFPRLEKTPPWRGNMVVTGVCGEQHKIGAALLADAMSENGWSVRFLGTNLPHASVVEGLAETPADVLCISATLLANLPASADLVRAVQTTHGERSPRIVLGGAAFQLARDFGSKLGHTEVVLDLRQAVATLCP